MNNINNRNSYKDLNSYNGLSCAVPVGDKPQVKVNRKTPSLVIKENFGAFSLKGALMPLYNVPYRGCSVYNSNPGFVVMGVT